MVHLIADWNAEEVVTTCCARWLEDIPDEDEVVTDWADALHSTRCEG
jgi:hypothetical protein